MFTKKILLERWSEAFGYECNIDVELGGDENVSDARDCHWNALRYLEKYQETVLQVTLQAVYREYPEWREDYGYDEEELDEVMPEIKAPENLLNLLKPYRVNVLNVEKEDTAYYGIEFACSWDEEHGLGVMLHNGRVIEVGEVDSAFLSWIAKNDRDSKAHEDIRSPLKMACNIRK